METETPGVKGVVESFTRLPGPDMKTTDSDNPSTATVDRPSNRRSREASALRGLFQEQWQQLRRRIRLHDAFREREKRADRELAVAVESVVAGTDGRMRAVSRYQKRLRHSTRCLLNYINESIHQLPPATLTNRRSYYRDPFLQHLFGSYRNMEQLFRESRLLQSFPAPRSGPEAQYVYALLTCHSERKHHLGCEIQGEMIVRDTLQTVVTFGDPRIVAVAGSETEIRARLKTWLFEHVVAYLRDYMTRLHHDLLTPGERSELPGRGEGIDDPRRYLEVLEWLLSLPLELLQIHSEWIHLDRIGVVRDGSVAAGNDSLRLDELIIGNHKSQVISVLAIER